MPTTLNTYAYTSMHKNETIKSIKNPFIPHTSLRDLSLSKLKPKFHKKLNPNLVMMSETSNNIKESSLTAVRSRS